MQWRYCVSEPIAKRLSGKGIYFSNASVLSFKWADLKRGWAFCWPHLSLQENGRLPKLANRHTHTHAESACECMCVCLCVSVSVSVCSARHRHRCWAISANAPPPAAGPAERTTDGVGRSRRPAPDAPVALGTRNARPVLHFRSSSLFSAVCPVSPDSYSILLSSTFFSPHIIQPLSIRFNSPPTTIPPLTFSSDVLFPSRRFVVQAWLNRTQMV